MSFYEQGDDGRRITFDEADELVARFVERMQDRRSVVRTADVAKEMSVPNSRHNQVRLHQALDRICPITNPDSSSATKFRLPDIPPEDPHPDEPSLPSRGILNE